MYSSHIGDFKDKRRSKCGEDLVVAIINKQTANIKKVATTAAEDKRFLRFLNNPQVTLEELTDTVSSKISQVVENRHVLVIQDTTEVNFQHHANRKKGFGAAGNGKDIGFFLHPAMVLDADTGSALGLSNVLTWGRSWEEKTEHYKTLPIEDKESFRWVETAQKTKERLHKADLITFIADRESDIYEKWDRIPDAKTHIIVRASRDRSTTQGRLYEVMKNLPQAGGMTVEVSAQKATKEHKARTAHQARLTIKFGAVEILKPALCKDKNAAESIRLWAIEAVELPDSVLPGEPAVHWRLLTTHKVETLEEALKILGWYTQRWMIEQLFRTLKKQGLNVESSQIETMECLQKLVVIATYAAIITMQLLMSRDHHDQSIDVVFSKEEQEFMRHFNKTLEGKTEKLKNPHPPEKLSYACWIIARLGGWYGYKSERAPGPIRILEGLQQFEQIFRGWKFAQLVAKDVSAR